MCFAQDTFLSYFNVFNDVPKRHYCFEWDYFGPFLKSKMCPKSQLPAASRQKPLVVCLLSLIDENPTLRLGLK